MQTDDQEDQARYTVVINHEEQYSIWPAGRPLPAGWRALGKAASQADCLRQIAEAWTDDRPASLRRALDDPAR